MRNQSIFIFLLLLFFTLKTEAQTQVEAELTIENQEVVGTSFFFNIYLNTPTGSVNDLYLASSDFILNFNQANFSNPTLEKVTQTGYLGGYNNLVSTSYTNSNDFNTQLNVQFGYHNNIATDIINNELVINLNGLAPGNQGDFNDKVAKIDDSPSTYCLGRFEITGISNPAGTAGLNWKITGTGLTTKVFTYENLPPFNTNQISGADLSAINPENVVLPVVWLSFHAKVDDANAVVLEWTTAEEINNDYFSVEKSFDGQYWEKIGEVASTEDISEINFYSFVDKRPENGINYYRLKQVDKDGSFEYSSVVKIEFEGAVQVSELEVFPNPVTNKLSIRSLEAFNASTQILIVNTEGKILKQSNTKEEYQVELDLSTLTNGIYFLQISDKNGQLSQYVFVKE